MSASKRHFAPSQLQFLTGSGWRRHRFLMSAVDGARVRESSKVPRQHHFYRLNYLHYLTTSTYRRARLFDFTRWLSPIRRHANYGMSAPPGGVNWALNDSFARGVG